MVRLAWILLVLIAASSCIATRSRLRCPDLEPLNRPVLENIEGMQSEDGTILLAPEMWDNVSRNSAQLILTIENYENLIEAYNEATYGN